MEQFPRSLTVSKDYPQRDHASQPATARKRLRSSVQPTEGTGTKKSSPFHRYGTRLRTRALSKELEPPSVPVPAHQRMLPSPAPTSAGVTAEKTTLPSLIECTSASPANHGQKNETVGMSPLEVVITQRMGIDEAGPSSGTKDKRDAGRTRSPEGSGIFKGNIPRVSGPACESSFIWSPQVSRLKGHSRTRSRLSIKRRPLPSVEGIPGCNLGGRTMPESATVRCPHDPLRQQQSELQEQPSQMDHVAPLEGQCTSRSSAGSSSSILAPSDVNLCKMSYSSGGSPPPFVGLKNLGNSCFINAVLQALLACPGFLARLRVRRGIHVPLCDDRGRSSPQTSAENIESCSSIAYSKEGVVPTRQMETIDACSTSTILSEVANLLHQMSVLNTELSLNRDDSDRKGSVEAKAQRRTAGALDTIDSSVTEPRSLCRSSSDCSDAHDRDRHAVRALVPSAVVKLIRSDVLNESQEGGKLFDGHNTPGLSNEEKSSEFGGSQQCASELLNRLLDLDTGIVDTENNGEDWETRERESGRSSTRRRGEKPIGDDFRGVLCVRTRCVECERENVRREPFAELVVPPLVGRPVLHGYDASRGCSEGEDDDEARTRRTLEELVASVLGSESLEGTNKIWCKHCLQWTEADRRTSLQLSPRILVVHVRPATRESRPGAAPLRPRWCFANGAISRLDGSSVLKARLGTGVSLDTVLQRRLTVSASPRCGPNEVARETQSRHPPWSTRCDGDEWDFAVRIEGSSWNQNGEDVSFDLVGVILHHGQTIGSGHYTFALNARSPSPAKVREADSAVHSEPSKSPLVGDGARTEFRRRRMDAGSSANKGELATSLESNTLEARFVLFDDDDVRWLSAEEEKALLSGGGGGCGSLGDVFLAFYARCGECRSPSSPKG